MAQVWVPVMLRGQRGFPQFGKAVAIGVPRLTSGALEPGPFELSLPVVGALGSFVGRTVEEDFYVEG